MSEELLCYYWEAYIDMLDKIGQYSRTVKLEHNAYERGVYPTQKVLRDFFPDEKVYVVIEAYRVAIWRAIRTLQDFSQRAGFRKINDESWVKFVKWAADSKRLSALRSKAKREWDADRIMDPEEILDWYLALHPDETRPKTLKPPK